MTRIVKRKKKRKLNYFNIFKLATATFITTGVLFICSATFLRSYNVSLQGQITTMHQDIASLQREKTMLFMEVTQLSSKKRIEAIVKDEAMAFNGANIVTIAINEAEDKNLEN